MSVGIYLHIPFCKQKCLYCDFNSYAGKENLMEEYCSALMDEVTERVSEQEVDTVYFGGGTPTVLGADKLAELLEGVRKASRLTPECEITTECNPGTIDKDGLERLYQAGFNRLSIGLQSTDDAVLKKLGRIHHFSDFQECFQNARKVGFSNLSFDLMYGLPEQEKKEWEKTLETALAFQPEHLSCYGLKVEEGTPFFEQNLILPSDDEVREMYDCCVSLLGDAGYDRYEISNFARPGLESRHNLKYWRYHDFIGLGAGAYSCVSGVRSYNTTGIMEYSSEIKEKKSAEEERIVLSKEEQMSEFCFLGLRTSEGIGGEEFKRCFGLEIDQVFGDVLKKNMIRKTMVFQNGRYVIAPEYLFVSNSILADFV